MTFVADGSFLESSSDSLIWLISLLRIEAAAVAGRCWKAAQLSHQIFTLLVLWMCSLLVQQRAPLTCITRRPLTSVGTMDIGGIQCFSAELLHFFILVENVPHLKLFNIELKIHCVASGGGFCLLIPLQALLWSSCRGRSRRPSTPTNSRNVTWISNSRGIKAQLENKIKSSVGFDGPSYPGDMNSCYPGDMNSFM